MDSLITDLLGDFESNVTKVQEKIGDVAAKEICLQFSVTRIFTYY